MAPRQKAVPSKENQRIEKPRGPSETTKIPKVEREVRVWLENCVEGGVTSEMGSHSGQKAVIKPVRPMNMRPQPQAAGTAR